MRRLLALGLLLIGSTTLAAPPEAGPRLTFQDIRYLKRSLDDFPERRAYVLVFTMTSCPVANRYWPALNRMERAYRDQGVQFIALNVGAEDSITAIAAHAVEHEV